MTVTVCGYVWLPSPVLLLARQGLPYLDSGAEYGIARNSRATATVLLLGALGGNCFRSTAPVMPLCARLEAFAFWRSYAVAVDTLGFEKSDAPCSRLSIVRFATGPKRSMGHVLGAEKNIFFNSRY